MAETEYQPFEVDLDLSSTESWDGEDRPLVPIGTYKVEIVGVTNHGKRIEIKFKIVEGEHAGAFVWNNYQIDNDTGKKRMRNLMVACGTSLGKINSNELMGATLYVDVIHNQGKVKPDDMGNVREPKTFANVVKERGLMAEEDPEATPEPTPEPERPPVTKSEPSPRNTTSSPPADNGTRRGPSRRS